MIPTPSRRIDGDVTVGRHVIAGGDAAVRGSVDIGHNLRVGGWIEAHDIKGANKGVFSSLGKLNEAYPKPQDGWWAVVGDTLPGPLYIGSAGSWIATGAIGGPSVDNTMVEERLDQVENNITDLSDTISAKADAADVKQLSATVAGKADAVDVQAITDSLGISGGIATLGDDGRVPLSQLPVEQLKDVVEFDSMEWPAFVPAIEQVTALGAGEVVFLAPTGTFVFRSAGLPAKYYANWGGAEVYGEPSDKGRLPVKGKLYVDVSANTQYRWNGSKLVATGSHLALGDAAGTAFAGDKGEKLRADVEALAKDVDRVAEQMPVIVFDGIITDEQDLDSLPAGFYFHTGQNRFGYSEGAAQSWDPDDGHNGNTAEDRASCLFRCGVRLYHFVDDDLREFVDAERLDEMRAEIIDEVMTRLQGL